MKTRNIWLISDTHFGHDNAYRFCNEHGSRMRPWADSAEQGDEMMVEAWNSVVNPHDRVYHLGDVCIPRRALATISKCNGKKVLVRGNHDRYKLSDYAQHFDDIRGTHKIDDVILTHYPIHPESIPSWCSLIAHGHTHGHTVGDSRYVNVCVEQLDGLKPLHWDELAAMALALADTTEDSD